MVTLHISMSDNAFELLCRDMTESVYRMMAREMLMIPTRVSTESALAAAVVKTVTTGKTLIYTFQNEFIVVTPITAELAVPLSANLHRVEHESQG